MLVPTGIGASVGGFAGDAIPIARVLSAAVDWAIAHPNVLNGASQFWPMANVMYVEGYGIDRWCEGTWNLRQSRQNRVGIIFDTGIEADLRLRHTHALQAAQATLGLDIAVTVDTDTPLGVSVATAPSGASRGTLTAPGALLRAAGKALELGAEAIAIVARFPDDLDFSNYDQGSGVDPLAGVEAILSHLVVHQFGCPAAHAPALRLDGKPSPVHPRAAAEEIGFTFLPSVLVGLSYAPHFVSPDSVHHRDLSVADLDVAIAPASAFGSPALLALAERKCPPLLIAVTENTSVMEVHPDDIGVKAVTVGSYMEAIGVLTAHRAGVALASVLPADRLMRANPRFSSDGNT